jgi:hypothetical protein
MGPVGWQHGQGPLWSPEWYQEHCGQRPKHLDGGPEACLWGCDLWTAWETLECPSEPQIMSRSYRPQGDWVFWSGQWPALAAAYHWRLGTHGGE